MDQLSVLLVANRHKYTSLFFGIHVVSFAVDYLLFTKINLCSEPQSLHIYSFTYVNLMINAVFLLSIQIALEQWAVLSITLEGVGLTRQK